MVLEHAGDAATEIAKTPERKFLVMAETCEAGRKAIYFAARRAKHANGRVKLLYVIEPADQAHWVSVEKEMKREAYEAADAAFKAVLDLAYEESGRRPVECVIREGEVKREVRQAMKEDPMIDGLVLSGAVGLEGPGALTAAIINQHDPAAPVGVPVIVVPDQMSFEDIRQVS